MFARFQPDAQGDGLCVSRLAVRKASCQPAWFETATNERVSEIHSVSNQTRMGGPVSAIWVCQAPSQISSYRLASCWRSGLHCVRCISHKIESWHMNRPHSCHIFSCVCTLSHEYPLVGIRRGCGCGCIWHGAHFPHCSCSIDSATQPWIRLA